MTAIIVIPVVVVVALLMLVLFPWPCTAAVNGTTVESNTRTTVRDLVNQQQLNTRPGDLVAVDGSVIRKGEGEAMHITVNGEYVEDAERLVHPGDVIIVENGDNRMESFVEETQTINPPVYMHGTGAIHLYTDTGSPGEQVTRTGSVSGITTTEVTVEPTAQIIERINVDTGGEKVVALTFDDGPWNDWTDQILAILAANGAKATFFTVGDRIEGHESSLQAAAAAGNQICTHSWDHAAGDGHGVDLGRMTSEDRIAEITKGFDVIQATTGNTASSVIRVPGGNFSEETASDLSPYATSEIGWNIDTRDWEKPGVEAIVNQLMNVKPGYIVLMHDGGGDRSQTVAALQTALPDLVAQGFRFVTIDELLQYVDMDAVAASAATAADEAQAAIEAAQAQAAAAAAQGAPTADGAAAPEAAQDASAAADASQTLPVQHS